LKHQQEIIKPVENSATSSKYLIPARFLNGEVGCMKDVQAEEVSQTFLFSSAS